MERALYMAAMDGDTGFLTETRVREIETGYWDEYLLSKTPQNNNILHIASLHGKLDFMQVVFTLINFSPLILISQKNIDGETPLHIASKKGNLGILKLLVHYSKLNNGGGIDEEIEVAGGGGYELTWRALNSEGNTPLHEAIIHGRTEVARYLIELDGEVTGFVNNRQETPLHLAAQLNAKDDKQLVIDTIELINKKHASLTYKASKCPTKEESSKLLQLLLQKNSAPLYMIDEDGLTPLLRAANMSNVRAIRAIATDFPETTEVRDREGRTILHLLKTQKYEEAKDLMNIPEIVCLKDQQDCFGDTAALVAVKDVIEEHESRSCCDFGMLKALLASSTDLSVTNKDIITKQQSQSSCEFGMLKALLASQANFTITNKKGLSAATLIQQHNTLFSNMGKVQLDEELIAKSDLEQSSSIILEDQTEQKANIAEIRDDIEKANVHNLINNVEHLGMDLTYYGCFGGGNVLHGVLKAWIKAKYDNDKDDKDDKDLINFVEKVLEKFPVLLCQGDHYYGNTPLHILVRHCEVTPSFLDKIISKYFVENSRDELGSSSDEEVYCTPWKMKNVEGNTPLHEALSSSHVALWNSSIEMIVSKLANLHDKSIFATVNNRDETPLHVLCHLTAILEMEKIKDVTRLVLEANVSAAYKRDVEGLTPVLRAAQSGNIIQLETICEICPQSAQFRDNNDGRTFWHVIDLSQVSPKKETYSVENLLKDEQIKNLLHVKDDEGNTSVKRAIETRNYHLLKALREYKEFYGEFEVELKKRDAETQLLLPTIKFAELFPHRLERIVWEILKKVPEKSFFGVQESEINGYTQTLGVIAVLLATIAFTAAFTVPGGLRSQHEYLSNNHTAAPFNISPSGAPDNSNVTVDLIGTPVILGTELMPFLIKIAYLGFMVSDIITMCFATLVIYCLLWIMKTTEMKMVLIDVSIFLIQVCFYATMTTFMLGVFVTTIRVEPWLAYSAVIVCSVVMLLMNRWLFPIKIIFLCLAVGYEVIVQTIEYYCNRISPCCSTPEEKEL